MKNILFILFLINLLRTLRVSADGLGQFLHISDFHIDEDYDPNGDPTTFCRVRSNKNLVRTRNQPFGDHSCDSPTKLMEYMLDEAKMHLEKPDFVLWTGDTLPHEDKQNSAEKLLHLVQIASDAIRSRFPGVSVIPMLGNHDSTPDNLFDDHPADQMINRGVFEHWKDWIGESGKSTFLRGGYFRLSLASMVWLVLNTNLYYIDNSAIPGYVEPEDPAGQFDFLHYELEKAKQYNYSVNIVAHIPPGAFDQLILSPKWNEELLPKYNNHFLDLIVDYAPWIRWMMFGHFHRDTFRIVKDKNGHTVQRLFVGPSITPVYRSNNPAFRVVEYNRDTLELKDLKTYYVDLDELNSHGPDKVHTKLEYSMRDAYGLSSLEADSLEGLMGRIKRNQSLFSEYFRYNTVMYTPKWPNDTERIHHLCSMEFLDYEQLDQCKGIAPIENNSPHLLSTTSILILTFLSILMIQLILS